MEHLNPVSVGVDIGQRIDPTAIVVWEIDRAYRGRTKMVGHQPGRYLTSGGWQPPQDITEPLIETEYTIRHVERLPLNTGYPDVARRVAAVLMSEPLRRRERSALIDITGVGRPVFELIAIELRSHSETFDVELKGITFTGGDRYDATTGSCGKAYLVSRLQALLQRGAIHGPDTEEMRGLLEELSNYEIRIDQDAHFAAGVFRTGKHDDLATALGLACLEGDEQGIEPLDATVTALLQNFRG